MVLPKTNKAVLDTGAPCHPRDAVKGAIIGATVSCGGAVVLVDEAAESITSVDLPYRWRPVLALERLRWPELECAVRPLAVVVVDVDAQHAFEVLAVEDQQPVQTLGAHGPEEAFRDRVCLRRPHGRLDDPDAFAAEDFRRRGRRTCCRGHGAGSGRPGPRNRGRGCAPAG